MNIPETILMPNAFDIPETIYMALPCVCCGEDSVKDNLCPDCYDFLREVD